MADPLARNRALFWVLTLSFLTLAGVPSLVLMDTVRRYLRFVSGWDPGALKPTHVKEVPHRGRGLDEAPQVRFAEFRLKFPHAKRVTLAGDFNQWDPETLPMTKAGDSWELLLPLPPGRYEYVFNVDGKWVADPKEPPRPERGDVKPNERQVP